MVLFRRVNDDLVETRLLNVKTDAEQSNLKEDAHLRPGDLVYVPQNSISKISRFLIKPSVSMYMNPNAILERDFLNRMPADKDPNRGHDQQSIPTVRELVMVLFRQRKVFVCDGDSGVCSGVLYALMGTKYEANMKILVRRGRADAPVSARA